MNRMVIEIIEQDGSWFVLSETKLGPFFSKQRAFDLAEGMADWIRSSGVDVTLVVPMDDAGPPALLSVSQ